jgi:hypothetical protein
VVVAKKQQSPNVKKYSLKKNIFLMMIKETAQFLQINLEKA